MGLPLDIYRNAYGDCTNGGASAKVKTITIVNIDGPFEAGPESPAFRLESHVRGCLRLVPVDAPKGMIGPMMGGNYAATSDGRFGAACAKLLGHTFYGAVPIHDRYETREEYDVLSR